MFPVGLPEYTLEVIDKCCDHYRQQNKFHKVSIIFGKIIG
jgi:hypothetical protein